jgi:hypothetical protein
LLLTAVYTPEDQPTRSRSTLLLHHHHGLHVFLRHVRHEQERRGRGVNGVQPGRRRRNPVRWRVKEVEVSIDSDSVYSKDKTKK